MNEATNAEIEEAWETFNAAFREGYRAASLGNPNAGINRATAWEKGVNEGWKWYQKGKPLPVDPMWAVLKCDRLFR